MRHSDARRELTTVGAVQNKANADQQHPYIPTNKLVDEKTMAIEAKPESAPIRVADNDDSAQLIGMRHASGPPVVTEDQAQIIPRPNKRSIMTAPFGQDRRARMFAAGFGQAQDKPRQIDDVHNFFSVR